MALKRIGKELNDLMKSPDEYPDVVFGPVCENDLFNHKATILGPKNSPYENGIFFLNVKLPKDYPFKPPKIKFETKIYHPNIVFRNSSNDGSICCCFIPTKDDWSPKYTIINLLNMIRDLIANPIVSNLCGDEIIHDEYKKNYNVFVEKAKIWTKKYAC